MKEAIAPSVTFTELLSELINRLVKQIPYEYPRQAMGDIVQCKPCWKGNRVNRGRAGLESAYSRLNEFRTGIRCISDVSTQGKEKLKKTIPIC